jgi:chromosome segregation ATPase
MKYAKNAPVYPPNSAEYAAEMAERIEKEISRSEALANAAAEVLSVIARPHLGAGHFERFRLALADWLTGDSRDQLAKLKEQAAAPQEDQNPERLIYLVDQANRVRETIEQFEGRVNEVEKLAEYNPAFQAMGAMVPALQLQIDPYRRQLADLEQQISELQAEMEAESTSIADGDAPKKEGV